MGHVRPLLVVTGTRREAALVIGGGAKGTGVIVLAGGGDGARLARDLARLAPDACGIISFGTGGGLVLGQNIGDLVIGTRVAGTAPHDCDAAWVQALAKRLPTASIGPVFADGSLLASLAQKRAAAASAAIVADMESHLAAAAAARFNMPFAVLRCISDTAQSALPPAVAVAMRPDGGLALGAVLRSMLRQPGQVPRLIRTGTAFRRAFAALAAGAAAAGPRLGFDQL